MKQKKIIFRILIWSLTGIFLLASSLMLYLNDVNSFKKIVEDKLKSQLNCTTRLGDLDWDWNGLNVGITTSSVNLYDKDDNLVLQAGPTRIVWNIKNLASGAFSHFYSIDSTNLYLNAIRFKNTSWNLLTIFPPGPSPKIDNLSLHNSIVHIIDELNSEQKEFLLKDLNLTWKKNLLSNIRKVSLNTRIGSLTNQSLIKIKGHYNERKKFDWLKSELSLHLFAKDVNLKLLEGYCGSLIKDLNVKKLHGNFSGLISLKKKKFKKEIFVRSRTRTNDFHLTFNNKTDDKQLDHIFEIPKTDFVLNGLINPKTILIKFFKSHIDELSYTFNGSIINWSGTLPELDLAFKTNRFNLKSIKPFLPLSLVPPDTRAKIEPLNDDGFVTLNLKLKGPAIKPQYFGEILLDGFNLTAESGFLSEINGLNGKLILDNELLKIEQLNIPLENSVFVLKGLVNNKELKANFNVIGKDLNINLLENLIAQSFIQSDIFNLITADGKLDLNIDVNLLQNNPPEIKGQIQFHDARASILSETPVEIKNVGGGFLLDGAKVIFNDLNGLINNEGFSIQGDFSLKEDESVNLKLLAKHITIARFILDFLTSKTPFKPIAETITGDLSDLNLNISGTFTKPFLNGGVSINNISFSLPNLVDKISNVSGNLIFEGSDLVIQTLNGSIQNSTFSLEGYIADLFTKPNPRIRLITGDIELSSLWNYLKYQLKTTSLNAQAEALEKLNGIASVDIFLQVDKILGNIYFKNMEIKYKYLPFGLNNLAGRLVVGDKNINLFDLMGTINDKNNFNCNLNINDYLNPQFAIQGQIMLDLDAPALLSSINPNFSMSLISDGLIPTFVNFDIVFPNTNLTLYSVVPEMLQLDFLPYIKKPLDKGYEIYSNIDFNSNESTVYINEFNIKSNKLSVSTNGNIKNIILENPELMLFFNTNEPCGIFMIIEPIAPLMSIKVWGMTEFSGSISGTPSMYEIASNATFTELKLPEVLGKKLQAVGGSLSVFLDNKHTLINSMINDIEYASLKAKSATLSAEQTNPTIYLNELSIDGNPGNIIAAGNYNPTDGSIDLSANGNGIELSSLAAFILLDPSKLGGKTNFSFMIVGKGKTSQEVLKSSIGKINFEVVDGKFAQLKLLQKGLQFANIVGQGLFGFNVKNVFSLFFKYQDGSFNKIKGDIILNKGFLHINEFVYRAKDLFLNAFGNLNLNKSFIDLVFYGYLPERKNTNQKNIITGTLSIIPEALGTKRFFIPFISSRSLEYFKFEVAGDLKTPKRITGHARRSFRWLKKKNLQKEYEFVPKP